VDSLPRTSSGELDREGLPLPVLPGQAAGGKGALSDFDGAPFGVVMLALAGVIAVVAFLMTHLFWPSSTDLSVVPPPFAGLFTGLYVAECLSFGLGVSFLFLGRGRLARLGRPPWLTTLAHLSIVWLLIAWWPQDNFYRLAAKTDWGRQAVLVYGFNITLMIAAAVLVAFAIHEYRAD
jgi:ABC-type Co2+ transport system permease subunit